MSIKSSNDCHYEVAIEGVNGCGVHPKWLTANNEVRRDSAAPERKP